MKRYWIAMLAALGVLAASSAHAQDGAPPPPTRPSIDDKSVDLISGQLITSVTDISIGPNDHHGLQYVRQWVSSQWRHQIVPTLNGSTTSATLTYGGRSYVFTRPNATSAFTPQDQDGSTLSIDRQTFTSADGLVITFSTTLSAMYNSQSNLGLATSIVYPDGTRRDFYYTEGEYQVYCSTECSTATISRLNSITSSTGYQLLLSYGSNALTDASSRISWSRIARVTAINNAVQYCNPQGSGCTPASNWPYVSYTGSNGLPSTVTDPNGEVTTYSYTNGKLSAIRIPDATVDTVEITYVGATDKVSTVKRAGQTWTYTYGTGTTSVKDPLTKSRSIAFNSSTLLKTSSTDENSNVTNYAYCTSSDVNCPVNLLKKVTMPQGNATSYEYDARGNVTKTTQSPKTGSGNPSFVSSQASYETNCTTANQKYCNKPKTTTDQAEQVTNYEYDASSGYASKVSAPAPATGQARPETRTTFITLQASVKNSAGTVVLVPTAARFPRFISTCKAGDSSTCVGTANERVTELAYTPATTSRGTNLPVGGVVNRSGDNDSAQYQYFSLIYDDIGNLASRTDGANNISQMRYDAARQLTYAWTPDPDGAGAALPRAQFVHYGSYGLPDYVDVGTINADGTGFSRLQRRSLTYDGYGRQIFEIAQSGGVDYSLVQNSYDALGRTDCVAQRMNPAAYGSLPASACTLGTMGSSGRDRITKYEWTDAGRLYRTISGYGTPVQREDARYSYSSNGAVTQAIDGKGNVTSYEYDGHDRPLRTCYNIATCNSSAPDHFHYAYGTSGNSLGRITQQGVRGHAETIYTGYSYDALGRVTNIDYPGSGFFDQDVALTYDNFGQMTQAQDANTHRVTYSYDVLGRVTRQGDQMQSLAMTYDGAGRRTRLSWDDNSDGTITDFFVTYEYDPTGALKVIRENGSTALATFAYEALGRRSSLTLGNGAVTSYSYAGPTLSGLGFDLAGTSTTYDQSVAFQYTAAGQILARITSNNSYAWTGAVSTARSYASNALNQYTQVGSVTPTYDGKGNLTSASSLEGSGATWAYNVNNALVTSSNGTQLYQDPIGRMKLVGDGATWRVFEYDGAHVVSERRSSDQAIVHRYVFGPGDDEPLVWYDYSSGTLAKKFLTADERGSVVAVTNSSGAVLKINSYDEYGIPASGNMGMFQYTGQAWLPELGMYNYKARIYSPTLGRFLQTDPIGYGDGMNWYNYVGGDPTNMVDPGGLKKRKRCVGIISDNPLDDDYGREQADCGDWDDGKDDNDGVDRPSTDNHGGGGTSPGGGQQNGCGGTGFLKAEGCGPAPTPKVNVRSKKQICSALGASGYDVAGAWSIANAARKTQTNGQSNWNNPYLREAENWLTAAADYFAVPFGRTGQIFMHQYKKGFSSGTTPFSSNALIAGLDGLSHQGDTPEQLQDWCNEN